MHQNIARNAQCPCRSGRKYKRCCGANPRSATPATVINEASRPRLDTPALICCLPTRGAVSIETVNSIVRGGLCDLPHVFLTVSRKPVDVARNELARTALAIIERPSTLPWIVPELYVFWFDDDSFWRPESLSRALLYLANHREIDVLTGSFCAREPYCASSGVPAPGAPAANDEGAHEVALSGFHWLVHRADVLRKIGPDPFTPIDNLSEDFSFCKRAKRAGIRIFEARDVVIPHVDVDKGLAYLPGQPAWTSIGSSLIPPEAQRRHDYGENVDAARVRTHERATRFTGGPNALTGGGE